MTLRVVAFDLMDTVLRDPYRDALTAGTGMSVDELFARRSPSAWPAFERGEITEQAYFRTFGDVELDVEAFHRARREGYAWLPGMRDLLEDLTGQVLRVIASNYPVWIEEVAVEWLEGHVDAVVASHHLGARKPDPEFYARLCERLDVAPGDVLFVDDRDVNVTGALEAGLEAERFTNAASLRRRLRDEGMDV